MCGEPTLHRRRLMGGGVVENQVHVEFGGYFGVDLAQEPQELGGAVAGVQRSDDLSAGQVQGGVEAGGAVADVVVAGARRGAGQHRETGAVRLRAWIWVFSSTHSTNARSGGSRYSPTTSRTLATNNGSLDSFHESCLCGANPNARHTRDTIDWLNPRCWAIDRVDQCVASVGVVSKVAMISASIWSSPTTRGRPGRARRPTRPGGTRRSGCATAAPC